jgi:hypothetical protein
MRKVERDFSQAISGLPPSGDLHSESCGSTAEEGHAEAENLYIPAIAGSGLESQGHPARDK